MFHYFMFYYIILALMVKTWSSWQNTWQQTTHLQKRNDENKQRMAPKGTKYNAEIFCLLVMLLIQTLPHQWASERQKIKSTTRLRWKQDLYCHPFETIGLLKGDRKELTITLNKLSNFRTKTEDFPFKLHHISASLMNFSHACNEVYIYPTSLDQYFAEKINVNEATGTDLMRFEIARFESFKAFPPSSPVSPLRLSQAGFFWTKTDDETECFACGLKCRDWQLGEVPYKVHSLRSPDCPFISGKENTNISLHNDSANSSIVAKCSSTYSPENKADNEVCKAHIAEETLFEPSGSPSGYSHQESNIAHSSIGINTSNQGKQNNNVCRNIIPRRPELSSIGVRISTFKGWPTALSQEPKDLAQAGFFYAGFGDCVRCFHCGGGLRNWEYGDDPWTEHARWYPECAHVRACKGDEYVDDIQEELKQVEAAANGKTSSNMCAGNKSQRSKDSIVSNDTAQSVLEMGYSTEVVKVAVDSYQRERGHCNFSLGELVNVILDIEDNKGVNFTGSNNTASLVHKSPPNKVPTSEPDRSSKNKQETKVPATPSANGTSARKDVSPDELELKESLIEENRQLKEHVTCKICMDDSACVVFLPCSHMVCCPQCAPALRKCPICRKLIKGTVRAFLS